MATWTAYEPTMKQEDKVFNFKKEFIASLEQYLTCSKCKKVPRDANVSWCTEHHLMCQDCYYINITRTDKHENIYCSQDSDHSCLKVICRHCKHNVEREHIQCGATCQVKCEPEISPFVDKMLQEFPTKCKFTQNGCQVFIMLKELEVHEVDCDYHNINCPFPNCCSKDVSFIDLSKHLEAKHRDLKKIDEARSKDSIPMPYQGQVWIPQKLVFRHRSFFTEVHVCDLTKCRYFWIYFHGSREEADHYTYQIKITGGNSKELIFKGKVYSLDKTKKTVMANEDVFILYPGQAKQFKVAGKINFEITLYSDKEEIKNEDVESGISDDDEE
jgi:hypothetical protein